MIYLDNNSTTRVDPRVLDFMLPFFSEDYGNAASTTHEMGRKARQAVDDARSILANYIGASPDEIYFTSGATESNNLAIRGLATHRSAKIKRLVTASTEHRAVLDPVKRLEKEGFEVERISPNQAGEFDATSLSDSVTTPTMLVSLMAANNEIGNCLDLEKVAKICHENQARFHSDAAQALGKLEIDVRQSAVDLLSFSGHKIYGPKGVGALYVRKGTRLKAIIDGGGHESGKRSGTLNVPGIVGFGKAVEILSQDKEQETSRIRQLMELCDQQIQKRVGGATLNGPDLETRLLGNLNYQLEGIDAETLTLGLPDVCISTGSACTSADPEPSHVLQAIGLNESEARSSIRIGIGRFNTSEDIEQAVEQIAAEAKKLRSKNA